MSFKYKVFISYEWASQNEVIMIKNYLEKNNIKVWFDRSNLKCKEGSLHSQLSKGIEDSELFVCIITKKYDESENCKLEFGWARAHKKPMIVVMLESIEITNLKEIGILIAGPLRINYFINNDPKEILDEILKVLFLDLVRYKFLEF